MNLLKNGIEEKSVYVTDTKKKLVIDQIAKDYPVYQIRLDKLYYNDQNDRISTWVSEHKNKNNIETFDLSDKENYNKIIHDFIIKSNKDAIKKTQANIELVGQMEPGVVLADGRIIDGNRRFTCLRNIQEETGKTGYFNAVILDHSIENNEKQIKMLELMLQHGVDEKIGYSPIDKLVGVYNDIIDKKLLTSKEYASSINVPESEIILEIEKAKLMVEFLEFINAPKQFYQARQLNIVDPLKELNTILKKINDPDKKEDLKSAVFAQFLVQPYGDLTRYMRRIKKIVSNGKFLDEYIDEQMDTVEKVCDEIVKHSQVTENEIGKIRENQKLKNEFLHTTEKIINKVDGDATRNQPVKQAEKAFDSLDLIDLNILKKMTPEQIEELKERLEEIEEYLKKIKEAING